MTRIASLLSAIFLTVAAAITTASLAQTAKQPAATLQPEPTVFSFDGRYKEFFRALPLPRDAWAARKLEAKVPLFVTGTQIGDVVAELQNWNLRPLVSNDHIFVMEGPSLHNFKNDYRSMLIYAFEDFQLYLGPLNTREAILQLVADGLSDRDLALLGQLEKVLTFNANSLNEIAWSLATHHDAAYRDAAKALRFARRSNAMSKWSALSFLDTLAAAFAANGEFESAVYFQKFALVLLKEPDVGMTERLQLYEKNEPYVRKSPAIVALNAKDLSDELLPKAQAGDAAAQFDLAVFYIENDIQEADSQRSPGKYWLRQAADNGQHAAIEEIGFALLNGVHDFDMNPEAARPWLFMAAENDSDIAAYNLGRMYRDALGIEHDDDQASRWFEIASRRGIGIAAVEMSYRYLEGAGVPRSEDDGRHFLDVAIEADIDPISYLFDDSYLRDAGTAVELQTKIFSRREWIDFPTTVLQLADKIDHELNSEPDYITVSIAGEVFGWPADHAPEVKLALVRVAARLGASAAQLKLAEFYERGIVVESSPEEARYWQQRARNNETLQILSD